MSTLEVRERQGDRKQAHERHVLFGERDERLLLWIGEQYGVRLDTLQRLVGQEPRKPTKIGNMVSYSAVRKIIDRWRRLGLVGTAPVLAREPSWIWLTQEGMTCVDLPYRVWAPTPAVVKHLHAVNGIRLRVLERHPDARWTSERRLRYESELAERATRIQEKRGSRRHLPDAEVRLGEQRVAVEIELSPKVPTRLQAIMEDLTQYDTTWYFVGAKAWSTVKQVRDGLAPDIRRFIRVHALDEVL